MGVKASRKRFDPQQFERLCSIQCTGNEIAHVLGYRRETLQNICKEHYGKPLGECIKEFSAYGIASLKRAQWEKALDEGSEKMMIHLGKHYADQKDTMEVLTKVQVEQLFGQRSNKEIEQAIEALDITQEQIESISDT
ncbi:MAG: hypothetical protein ACO2ZP_09830 [Bacteriovoracaceae bacterium]